MSPLQKSFPLGLGRATLANRNHTMSQVDAGAAPVDLASAQVPPEFLERIPLRFARENVLIAIHKSDGEFPVYTLAAGLPDRHWAIDRVAYKLDGSFIT